MNNFTLANVGKKQEDYLKLISDESLFSLPNFEHTEKYSPESSLEDNEWFYVEKFSDQDFYLSILKKNCDSVDYNLYKKSCDKPINFIIFIENDIYYFQKIVKANFLKPKRHISIGEDMNYLSDEKIITLKEIPDAIYMKNEDRLYFKKLEYITSIFIGISELYRAATQEEVENFLKSDFINMTNKNYTASDVSVLNRKRIALLKDTFDNMTDEEKKNLISYTQEYAEELKFENGQFCIGKDNDLKQLLYGIGERYYTTEVHGEKRLAKSILRIDNKN